MSEIEKMMQNANVKKHWNSTPYGGVEEHYPPFTAEKQLELIKWLIKYDELHADFNDNEYGFSTLNYSGKYKKDFAEALASVINRELWQDLTEEEKQQVKGILK